MRSVKLKAKFFFLALILLIASNGYSDTCTNIYTRTDAEATGSSIGKGLANFFTGKWGDLSFDPHLLKEIKVTAVKDQGVDGYFNPKIQVCNYEGDNCYILPNKTSCHKIYGTQASGAGISAAVFIDWEGDKMLGDGKIKEGIAKDLEWEWVDNVTDEEKKKFANSPKICACSQKAACVSGIFEWADKVGEGANIFRPGKMENVCDTCYQTAIKCAPIPLAPGPPPLCEQLAMSPPQVRIVPITNQNNDDFHPRVGVIIGETRERRELPFPRVVSSNENIQSATYPIPDKDTHHYFKTYRKKGQLCAEYHGTEREESKRKLQFPARCFPTPPTPEPEVVEIVQSSTPGEQSNTLKIRVKMSENVCTHDARGTHSNGVCTFYVNKNSPTYIGPLSLKVAKPAIVAKMTDSNNNKSYIDNIIEGILKNNSQFEVLKKYGYVPDIETECKEFQGNKCKLNNLGQPEVEIKYKDNSNSKMLCLSGWQPEPEEFILKRGDEIIPLKLRGTKYVKYNAVYSKESNQFYYLPSKEIVDLLNRPQDQLDKIIFNKQGYVFFPDENKQKKGERSYCVNYDKDIDERFTNDKVKVVYKLIDAEHKEECKQGDDGCICFNGTCSRSTRYEKGDQPFYLKVSQDENGVVTQLEAPIKANRTEVFYADKLCMFDLEGLKKKLKERLKDRTLREKLKKIINEQLKNKKPDLEKKNERSYDSNNENVDTDDLSIMFDHVEIEAWGSGEAGHIEKAVHSTESRAGMPGDYIKTKLKINPDYPIIKVQVTEGGGNQTDELSQKDGGPLFIKMCRSDKQDCKPLITVAGGGMHKIYGPERTPYKNTIIHEPSLELEKTVIPASALKSTEDNKITYIEDGQVKYTIESCESNLRSNKPGAGGCIDKNKGIYGKGSPGYVKIRPIIEEFNEEKINAIIKKVIDDQYDLETMTDFWIGDLNVNISKIIEEEVKKELLR